MAKANPYLKVKLKSLAAEARIIRHEERKTLHMARCARSDDVKNTLYGTYESLHLHRISRVRSATRFSLLAYQYIRKVPYAVCEQPTYSLNTYQIKAIEKIVRDFGYDDAGVKAWVNVVPDTAKMLKNETRSRDEQSEAAA